TIYGFRRGRPKYRGLWLALLVLASLSVLPRVLSPIAEKLWGTPQKTTPSAEAIPQPPPTSPEAGSAFAAPEPAAPADTMDIVTEADTVAITPGKAPSSPAPRIQTGGGAARGGHARAHRARSVHGKAPAEATSAPSDPAPSPSPPPRPRLVPPPR